MRSSLILVVLLFACALSAPAQIISTIAGNALYDRSPATQTPLNHPTGVAVDAQGNFWIADTSNHVIRRVDAATGIATVVAGGGSIADLAQPVPATSAALEQPTFVALDRAGNVYFCETRRHVIRKISRDGLLTIVAGTGQAGPPGDPGPATRATLNAPEGLAVDASGNLYISDSGNGLVRRVAAASGVITTVAGGGSGGDGGLATSAALRGQPRGIAFDSRGNLHFAVQGNPNVVKRVDASTGIITTVAGGGATGFDTPDNLPATSITLNNPYGIGFDAADNLFISNYQRVLKVSRTTGLVSTTLFPVPGFRFIDLVGGLAVDPAGKIVYAHRESGLLLRIDPDTRTTTVVAGASDPFDGPLALGAVSYMYGLASDWPRGLLYLCDKARLSIRKVELATGQISTLAPVSRGDCWHVAVDPQGNVYYSEDFTRIRRVSASTGAQTTFAGSDQQGFSGDGGPATQARLGSSRLAITFDAAGNLYMGDEGNNRIRRVDAASGVIQTVVGGGQAEEGPALTVGVRAYALAFDNAGNLLIGEDIGGLRRYNPTTGMVTVVFRGGRGYAGDGGPAINASSGVIAGMAVDAAGNIFIADGHFHVVRRIEAANAANSVISTLAGSGVPGFFGDGGLARLARMDSPSGLAVDAQGNAFVSETLGGKLRKITPAPPTPILAVSESALTFNAIQGGTPPEGQTFRIASANLAPLSWSTQVVTTGGTWLRATPISGEGAATVSVFVDQGALTAGTYTGAVRVNATGASGSPKTIPVTLNVAPPGNPTLGLSSEFLSFSAIQGGANPPSQTVSITNLGSGTVQWTATLKTSGGDWLKISSASGTAPSFLVVSAASVSLTAGVYTGLITVRDTFTGNLKTVSVTLVVSRTVPILQPSQTGFLFQGIEGAANISAQTFQVLNVGQGSMNWQVRATTADGRNWLSVGPTSGTSDAGAASRAPTVTLRVDPAQLKAGVYVGLLTFEASGAPNSPQVGIVLVNILAPGSDPLGLVQPAGLIFIGTAGGLQPAQQELTLTSTGGKLLQFVASPRTTSGGNWLTVTPSAGSLSGSGDAVPLRVQASTTGLAAGIYTGAITVSLNTGKSQDVAVALVVTAALVGATAVHGAAAVCTPTKLAVVETLLAGNFLLSAGWPAAMRVQIVDDCGQPVTEASVTASFTSGDPLLVLANLKDGRYAGTWVPVTEARTVTVTLRALAAGLPEARVQLTGNISAAGGPLTFRNGSVNAASYAKFAPLAPGSIFSLFGRNLAAAKASATSLPLPQELGQVRVTLGGAVVPLFYADSGQVNGQVPMELAPGTTASLLVTVSGVAAPPDQVTLAAVQPGIFTVDQSGTGQGAILNAANELVNSAKPATSGDILQIFCTGLGPTTPAVASGAGAPGSPPATVNNAVTATIGGGNAVVHFAGLAPGFVGLYQVNVQVPAGVAAGPAVPLVLTQSDVSSNAVTIAVR